MVATKCTQCGASIDSISTQCKYCGEAIAIAPQPQPQQFSQPQPQANFQQPVYFVNQPQQSPYDQSWPIKNKNTAGILAILLGGLGVHKFYLGNIKMGVVYLIFCWTYIPAILGVIEGILYLTSNEHNFQIKHKVRLQ